MSKRYIYHMYLYYVILRLFQKPNPSRYRIKAKKVSWLICMQYRVGIGTVAPNPHLLERHDNVGRASLIRKYRPIKRDGGVP